MKLLDRLSWLKKVFTSIHSQVGLIAIDCDGVHLNANTFFKLFPEWTRKPFNYGGKYHWEFEAYHNGVRFFCLTEE